MQNLTSPLLHSRNIGLLQPLSVIKTLLFDLDVIDAGVLGEGMIAEDIHTLDVAQLTTCLTDDLPDSSIVIESGEAGDVLLFDMGGEVTEDICVSVGRVRNDETLHVGFCLNECFSLLFEDVLVCFKEVLAFHARFAWVSSQENNHIGTLEHLFWLRAVLDLGLTILTERTNG